MWDKMSHWLDPEVKDGFLVKRMSPIYKQVSDRLGMVVFLLMLSVFFFLLILFSQFGTVHRDFFSVSPNQQVVPIATLDVPVYSSDRIKNWTAEAVKDIYSANFNNADQKALDNRRYFTPNGVVLYELASKAQMDSIKEKHLNVVLTPTSSAYILGKWKQRNGMSIWKVEVSVLLIYQGSFGDKDSESVVQKKIAALTILQVPTTTNPGGLGIASLVLEEPSSQI